MICIAINICYMELHLYYSSLVKSNNFWQTSINIGGVPSCTMFSPLQVRTVVRLAEQYIVILYAPTKSFRKNTNEDRKALNNNPVGN